jgi:hypothetical protein
MIFVSVRQRKIMQPFRTAQEITGGQEAYQTPA